MGVTSPPEESPAGVVIAIAIAKTIAVASIGTWTLLVGVNNVLDYATNLTFVTHVLSMDTTFEGNALMWRAIRSPVAQQAAYILIIAWECTAGLVCLAGAISL